MERIRRVGVLKMALFMGIYSAAIGLIMGLFVALVSFIPGAEVEGESMFNFIFGLGAIIILPIISGIWGFIFGIIFTPVMNLVLKLIGGLDLDIESDQV